MDFLKRIFKQKPQKPVRPTYGNPQLGKGDPDDPHPVIHDIDGNVIGNLSICEKCGGYYWLACPCWAWQENQ